MKRVTAKPGKITKHLFPTRDNILSTRDTGRGIGKNIGMRFAPLLFVLFLSACAAGNSGSLPLPENTQKETLVLTPAGFGQLPGWTQDDLTDAASAFQKTCARLLKIKDPNKNMGSDDRWGKISNWQAACRDFLGMKDSAPTALREFFEKNFIPYQVSSGDNPEGLFTGYYESSLQGSRTRKAPYLYPLRGRPDDLVMVDLGLFRDELKGQRIAGRVEDGNLKPYQTHAQINAGKLPPDQDKPLVWVDNAADAFFVQIQGSGLVELDDGSTMRIGYAGQNGHPYYAVGRELVKQGVMPKEQVSMQSIRAWMDKNPSEAQRLMETNPSYVFFREIEGEGPIGGEAIPVTALRTLAIDRSLMPYGLPIWLSAEHPDPSQPRMERLMFGQDTGGAIRGAVRGDVFWGHGPEAEHWAGLMKSKGQYWVLLPRTIGVP